MITPRFRLDQNENSIIIVITAPHVDLNATEIDVDENQVRFASSPYYLRLHLPGPVIDDDMSKGNFNSDTGEFTLTLSKVNKGEKFEGLDMLSALLNPVKNKSNIPNIEVIGSDKTIKPSVLCQDFDWFIEQKIEDEITNVDAPKYGFANLKSGIFCKLESELPELLDLPYPDKTASSERAPLQHATEDKTFSVHHYLADWAEENTILPLIHQRLPWETDEEDGILTRDEEDLLLKLPRREILPLEVTEQRSAMLGLAELIYCWAHEQRSSAGDPGPESARSVRRLSATFSWLRQFHSAKQLVHSCIRRALCVPLYRNWNFAIKTLQDTTCILKKGRIRVLKVLLSLHQMFAQCESHHVLSQIYIEPYCIWLQQSVSDFALASLAAAMEKATPKKSEIGWELEELEHAAKLTMEEEESEKLVNEMKSKLLIKTKENDSDDSSSSSSSDDYETESSSGDYSCSSDVEGGAGENDKK